MTLRFHRRDQSLCCRTVAGRRSTMP